MSLLSTDTARASLQNDDVRQRILEAAMRCFSESGFHSASMQQICAAAQMSPGGVYRYFASKDEIIAAIFDRVHARNTGYLDRMASEGLTLQRFSDVGFSCLRDMTSGPERGLFCEVFAEAQRNPTMRGTFDAKVKLTTSLLRGALQRLQSNGEIDAQIDLDTAAILLMAITDGLMMRMQLEPSLKFEALWPPVNDLIMRMLRPRGVAVETKTSLQNSMVPS